MVERQKIKGYVLRPGEELFDAGGAVKASGSSTGGSLTLIESRTQGGAPQHVHSREDECFYVVEGSITVQCGENAFEAGPRSFVFLPRGIPHSWDVPSGGAMVLIIAVPSGLEEFLREFHEVEGHARPRVAAKYGIELLPG